jgi:hypothetical protein
MKWMAIGAMLICVGGCHVSTSDDHTLVSDDSVDIPAGSCVVVEGPFNLPSGATNDYTINDHGNGDAMDVTIVDDSFPGCDFADGYGTDNVGGSFSSGTGAVPAGSYDFVVQCDNAVDDCQFDLSWSANY